MKRFAIAIIAIIYFTVSSGMVMNIHYCMGKVNSVKLDVFTKNLCGCKTGESKGCCKTEHKIIKLDDSHKASYAYFVFDSPTKSLPVAINLINAPVIPQGEKFSYPNTSLPSLSAQDIYLRNCVFRI